jgi:hypothetical protein
MIVAVITVRMMQAAVDDVIDVVAMRDCLVPAAGAVHVAARVARGNALVAPVGVRLADLDDVFVVVHFAVDLVRMVQVAIVQIVDMVTMANGLVATTGTVLVIVVGMGLAGLGHRSFSGVCLSRIAVTPVPQTWAALLLRANQVARAQHKPLPRAPAVGIHSTSRLNPNGRRRAVRGQAAKPNCPARINP